jgi:Sec-independent protein translocase protein TatA
MTPLAWFVIIIVAVVFFFPDRIPKVIRGFREMVSGYKDTTAPTKSDNKPAGSKDQSKDS